MTSGKLLGMTMIGFAICGFTPIIKQPTFLLLLLLLGSFLILIQSNSKGYRQNQSLVMCVYIYIFVCISYRLLEISDASIGVYAKHFSFFMPILLMPLVKRLTIAQCRWIFWLIVLVVLVNIADNIRLCILYPKLWLVVNRDILSVEMMDTMINIGGSVFYNGIYFFFTICFFCFLNSRQKKVRYLMFGCVLLSAVYIFVFCLKASIILFTCMSAYLLYYAKRNIKMSVFIWRLAIPSLLVLFFIVLFSDIIIEWISYFFHADRLSQRLIYIVDPDSADSMADNTVNARAKLWLVSINSWLDNPVSFIFGIGDHRVVEGQAAAQTGLSQHSDFLDSLGRYGLIGLFLLTAIFKMSFTYMMSFFEKKYKLQLLVIVMLFVMFGFTKGVFKPDIACSLFILLPMSAMYVNTPVKYNK